MLLQDDQDSSTRKSENALTTEIQKVDAEIHSAKVNASTDFHDPMNNRSKETVHNNSMLSRPNRKNLIPSHKPGEFRCQQRIFEKGVSYQGEDMLAGSADLFAIDAAACCRFCSEDSRCTHWTWLRNGCALKNGRLVSVKSPWDKKVVCAASDSWPCCDPAIPILR